MPTRSRLAALGVATLATASLAATTAVLPLGAAHAFTYVTDARGTSWGIQDSASPGADTGSIRATQEGTGVQAPYSTMLNGYGGLRVTVDGPARHRFDGALLRGFGLVEDGAGRFESTRSVALGGVHVTRTVDVVEEEGYGRWLDTLTNTTDEPLEVEVAFGGQTGYGASGTNASRVVATSSGDDVLDPADTWTASASGAGAAGATWQGPTATVVGDFDRTGDWLRDTFTAPYSAEGHAANYPAYVNTLTLEPGASASLVRFVAVGERVTAATADAELAAVTERAAELAAEPDLDGLSADEVASIVNLDGVGGDAPVTVAQPPAAVEPAPTTSVGYDVVDKTIAELQADMEAGVTTSVEITRAYLDRIAAYDEGPFAFNAFTTVAADALAKAAAADAARAQGRTGALLGIPIAVKDLYDTADMPTTNGSLTFEDFVPAQDAYQVAKLREAGAIIIGKASMEEYATSGSYSDNAFGTVWNAFDPSRSALASSGGSAVATATSMTAAALGSQTGDSLYAPAAAASLVTLRGTDGMQSDRGVMPLSWLQDYAGAMTRSVSDLADILNVVSGTDPQNPETAEADAHRPDDWRTVLDADALEGKRIGYVPSTWVDPYGTSTVIDASVAAREQLAVAGAELVSVADGPVAPARPNVDVNWEGWARYLGSHPELDMDSPADVVCSQLKMRYTTYDPSFCEGKRRMADAEIEAWRGYRVQYQENIDAWMDANDLDAVVYPGLLSEISLNDGGGNRSSFGRRDTPSGGSGVPTLMFPAGTDAHGAPVGIQLMGRAWSDAELVGYAYAFEQTAAKADIGHVAPDTAPALTERSAPTLAVPGTTKVAFGRATTVTVRLGSADATGTVALRKGGRLLAEAPVKAGVAKVKLPAKALRPGKHALTAAYSGDSRYAAASAAATVRVAKAASRTTATLAPKVVQRGDRPKVTVKVVGANGITAAGTVRVKVAGKVRTANLRNGKATLRLAPLAKAGRIPVKVVYVGSGIVARSTTQVVVRVTR
ncbi:amidase family protein [Nocardioides marmotae]|uniref:amidase family protein n=1 Tax=Nocardioides marmotae TaxID=2663857 RepID=UPI0012B5E4FA|nr:amidase family protein [Nocardioides marmotae]MBC9735616.1 Ig-like domain repeat protein [Nocardioides marmotae]MTB86712.1 amidase [Nocardioides marmotae]